MPYIITVCILLTLAYAGLMLLYLIGWGRQKVFVVPEGFRPVTSISVIIPARNEAANIGACIDSLLRQDYPSHMVEIILVDDHSDDNTAEIVVQLSAARVTVLSLKDLLPKGLALNSYKKKALSTGIAHCGGGLIVTTDADCIVPEGWLKSIAALYETRKAKVIIGPVRFTTRVSILDIFQSLDFTTMQGITGAAQQLQMGSMANGANLAFSRAAYEAVRGYEGIEHLASGDDYLLLHKLKQEYPSDIHYLKSADAIVQTTPQSSWSGFLQQRIRWASKSGKYSDYRLTAILFIVYLFNMAIVGVWLGALLMPELVVLGLAMMVVKVVVELVFLYPVARFFKNEGQLVWFPLLQPLHILYIVLAGFLGLWGKYQWKGRTVR